MASVLYIPVERMVYTKQTHTTNIKIVDYSHAGMGITRERDYDNIDGLVTNTRNLCLVSSYADCIPVTLVDEKQHVITAMHAGWKKLLLMHSPANGFNAMKNAFGCVNENIKAFIGPGICMDCYEVSSNGTDILKQHTKQEINLLVKMEKQKVNISLIFCR